MTQKFSVSDISLMGIDLYSLSSVILLGKKYIIKLLIRSTTNYYHGILCVVDLISSHL